jgi:hypothetical protein
MKREWYICMCILSFVPIKLLKFSDSDSRATCARVAKRATLPPRIDFFIFSPPLSRIFLPYTEGCSFPCRAKGICVNKAQLLFVVAVFI